MDKTSQPITTKTNKSSHKKGGQAKEKKNDIPIPEISTVAEKVIEGYLSSSKTL
jgi:hypothetical protein